jgi:hypothetical protein
MKLNPAIEYLIEQRGIRPNKTLNAIGLIPVPEVAGQGRRVIETKAGKVQVIRMRPLRRRRGLYAQTQNL